MIQVISETGVMRILQIEYAALDAVVLIHIFYHVRGHSQPTNVSEGHSKIEWKSYIVSIITKTTFIWKYILLLPLFHCKLMFLFKNLSESGMNVQVSHMDNPKKSKKRLMVNKETKSRANDH